MAEGAALEAAAGVCHDVRHDVRRDGACINVYGTRCSTVVVAERSAGVCTVHVVERSFTQSGSIQDDITESLMLQA